MIVEWDPRKARSNFAKHGVRFADAVSALEDEQAITTIEIVSDEERCVTIGLDSLARTLVVVVYVAQRESPFDLSTTRFT